MVWALVEHRLAARPRVDEDLDPVEVGLEIAGHHEREPAVHAARVGRVQLAEIVPELGFDGLHGLGGAVLDVARAVDGREGPRRRSREQGNEGSGNDKVLTHARPPSESRRRNVTRHSRQAQGRMRERLTGRRGIGARLAAAGRPKRVRAVTKVEQPVEAAIAAAGGRADPVRERLGERRPDCYGSDPILRLASLIFPRFTLLSTRLR